MDLETNARPLRVAKGSVLEGPYWPEPVRVLTSQIRDDRIEIDAVGLQTERYYSTLPHLDEFEANVEIKARRAVPSFNADPLHFRLAVEAQRIGLAYEYDPHFAISVSQIAPLPHQLAAVYDYILPRPRIRFMLADDPGAGKTIMAGLALKELKYRGVAERILIVVPAKLIAQWQRELKDKFGETFIEVNRALLQAFPGRNAWETHPHCVTSIDFAKQDDVMTTLREVHWDLVIVDEAHKMAAYRYGKKTDKTDRYQLGELLADRSDGLLFLTATPHKGDPDNFLLLLQLLDPDLYADTEILRQAVKRDENPIFLRRMKEQMCGFDGKQLFPDRHPVTVAYSLSKPERRLYDAVTKYVEDGFQRAFGEENRHVQLALLVLQRRLASSLRAIRRSLENRRDRLKQIHTLGQEALKAEDDKDLDWDNLADMPEVERWRVEDEALARHTMARDLPELGKEIDELENLIRLAQIAEASGEERKLQELREVMEAEGLFHSDEKLLIFTEAKDTLDYLLENLQRWGFHPVHIDGTMDMDSRVQAEQDFEKRRQVMVATEAAGEGINLQFCHLMVNYDIPWNPNRLAQRMGRIHRYGQKKEVFIFNLVASDTREGAVVKKLLEKLDVMRRELGTDSVFDVIDEVAQGRSLEQLFREALARRRTFDQILAEVDARYDPANAELVRKARLEGLATDRIDFSGVRQRKQEAEEHRLMPTYIERFFVEAFEALGEGSLQRKDEGPWGIDWLRTSLRDVPIRVSRRFGTPAKRYRRFTFHKDRAQGDHAPEFVAPGHPLFEAVRYQVDERFASTLPEGALFCDPEGRRGRLWLLRGGVRDGHGQIVGRRIFAVFESAEGQLEQWPLTSLLDLETGDGMDNEDALLRADISDPETSVINWSLDHCIDPYFDELAARRRRQAAIKERYLKRSFNTRISASMKKIGEYKQREQAGADMEMAIRQEQMRKDELMQKRDRRLAEVELDRYLSRRTPEIMGIAAVLPRPEPKPGRMHSSKEIEQIAMDVVMAHEHQQGWEPDDVSQENVGFDIRSHGPGGEVRRIEVKGRAGEGAVRLTSNEWMTAQQLGETFWLYIVVHCASEPQLWVMQNPASKLEPEEEIRVTSYYVHQYDWRPLAELRDVGYRAKGDVNE